MKHYHQPETNVLQVINCSLICASGPGPVSAPAQVSLNPVTKSEGEW